MYNVENQQLLFVENLFDYYEQNRCQLVFIMIKKEFRNLINN